jgi:hypothetical protein
MKRIVAVACAMGMFLGMTGLVQALPSVRSLKNEVQSEIRHETNKKVAKERKKAKKKARKKIEDEASK